MRPIRSRQDSECAPGLPNPALRLQFLVLSRGAQGGQRAGWAFAQPVAGSR